MWLTDNARVMPRGSNFVRDKSAPSVSVPVSRLLFIRVVICYLFWLPMEFFDRPWAGGGLRPTDGCKQK